MKICPKCQTQYDEEIIRFCTKDGSPLVEENPSFTAMPSQSSIDDIGEETLITRNRPVIPSTIPVVEEESAPRVVIPIGEEKKQAVRPLENPPYQQPPRKSNTAAIVLLTILGTVIVLGGGLTGWWLLSGRGSAVSNTNTNSNITSNNSNQPANYNNPVPTDFNTNISINSNVNTNANANLKTPTPTKTPTPKPSPEEDSDANVNVNTTIINISPSNSNTSTNVRPATPTPTPTPKPSPATTNPTPPSNVNIGVMNNRARELRKPAYPDVARRLGAAGQVVVQVSIDEGGNVTGARAVSGHPLLRLPAEAAARQSSFNPVKVGDKNVKANGTIVYNFINQ